MSRYLSSPAVRPTRWRAAAARRMIVRESMTDRRQTEALARALEHLDAAAWQPAHEIVQAHESTLAAWLHGIVHTIEGDLDNAQYWYRKAGRQFPGAQAVRAEITAARLALAEDAPTHSPKEER